MTNEIQSISIDKLVAHPSNPNRMSRANFAKLVRNIERTSRYEPLVVRPCPPDQVGGKPGYFQIINGHHRCEALAQLGYKTADAIVWDIDDQQADILLATLNRLSGCDVLDKKLALLARLNKRMEAQELAKLLPQTKKQIERLTSTFSPQACPERSRRVYPGGSNPQINLGANPLVFFVNDKQQQTIEKALQMAEQNVNQPTKAAKRAAALTRIAQGYLNLSGDPAE